LASAKSFGAAGHHWSGQIVAGAAGHHWSRRMLLGWLDIKLFAQDYFTTTKP